MSFSANHAKAAFSSLLPLASIVLASSVAFATVQELDEIRIRPDGVELPAVANAEDIDRSFVIESPLDTYFKKLGDKPQFDRTTTSNRKSYSATWMIRDNRLFLESFSAEKESKQVDIGALIPNARSPVFASWYTGQLRVISGTPIAKEGHPYYRAIFKSVILLSVRDGKIVDAKRLKNFRISPPGSAEIQSERNIQSSQKIDARSDDEDE